MAAMVGLRNHDKFDIIGTLGGPDDYTYLLHFIIYVGNGFGDLNNIEEAAKAGTLNEVSAYCNESLPKARFPFRRSSLILITGTTTTQAETGTETR